MECAQLHVNLVAQQSDGAVHLLNEKLDTLDGIAAHTRQRILAERDKIVKQTDAERDRALKSLAQMIEEEKQQIRNKSKELNELPLNEIAPFIRRLQSEPRLTDKDETLFNVNISMPQITIQRRKEQSEKDTTAFKSSVRSKYDDEDEYSYALKRISKAPSKIKSYAQQSDIDSEDEFHRAPVRKHK